MTGPLVSTIIPVHNRPKLLEEAVDSVLSQTYRPVEVLIVDDGSTDATTEVGERLAEGEPNRVRFVRREVPGGPGVAREEGRLRARGEFIQYLDSDDLLEPQKFEWQVNSLLERPECGVSYGLSRWHSGLTGEPLRNTGVRLEAMFPSFLVTRWWCTSSPLYRREVCDKVGSWLPLWNEEDWEYDCRIAALGTRLAYVPRLVSEERRLSVCLSADGSTSTRALRSRAIAHARILAHAVVAGIAPESLEMQHFSRELFLLSRQAGAAGLENESRMLFHLSRSASIERIGDRLAFHSYEAAAICMGWRTAGALAGTFDRLRETFRLAWRG